MITNIYPERNFALEQLLIEVIDRMASDLQSSITSVDEIVVPAVTVPDTPNSQEVK